MSVDFTQRWHEIEPLIDQLFDVPAASRADWLRLHCADPTLRVLIAQALDNAPGVDALERGMQQWLPAFADSQPDMLPIIPGYRVHRFVGAGGMASVFEAERELPGGPQAVALKLLRLDVHDADERRRFLGEQRILARLQHPHIAQLLDAGFSPNGTPYLALEFIDGHDLVTHAERQRLDTPARLRLFIDVLAAVDHAHRSLIVHRDLKPNNVLVGADGCVKLVDFGIAKLLTGEAEPTSIEARRLTRSYAAPEQFAGAVATTAIDVYSLGVLLAELACGRPPRRIEQRTDAGAPAFDDSLLRRELGADLHAIVQQATRHDPAERYASVAALRDDIERHLDGKPVQARPDTLMYRAITFARRHALAVSLGASIVVLLAGATVVALHEADSARRAARQAQVQALSAEAEARRADALKLFVEGLFDSDSHGAGASQTAEELLAHGRERADRDFARQPALRVEVLALIGDLEERSGHPDRAQQPLDEAATLARAQFGVTDKRTLHVEYLIAKESDALGHAKDARSRLRRALAAFESGPNRNSPEEVYALAWLAGLDERCGDSAMAIDAGNKALALARRILPDDSEALTEAVTNLGWILVDAGHPVRAEPLLREALARKRRQLGADHPEVADMMAMLTWALLPQGRYAESEQLMRGALAIDVRVDARPNAHLSWHLNDLGNVLALEGKFQQADALYTRSIAVDQALAPEEGLSQAVSIGNRARIRFRQGDYAEAEADIRDAIQRKQRLLGADYDDNGSSYDHANLVEVLIARGRLDEARGIADNALTKARRRHHQAHPDVAFALTVEAELMVAGGDRQRAASFAEQAVAMYVALADQASEKAIRARLMLGEILQSLGRGDEARSQLESGLAAAVVIAPPSHALVAHAEADLARVDASLGEHAAAARYHDEAEASVAAIRPGPNAERDATIRLLASASTARKPSTR
ncbi:MAG TPA: tetratricopeptide repeat protein [Rhodanobacter sp.]|nr:tetratricopeptide repeat protein [Rhodanobacter sp.]